MLFPAYITALPVTPLFEMAGQTAGGSTHHITDSAYLEGELVGAKDLTRGLTQAPSNHLDRVFRGGLKTAAAGAIQFTRPTAPTGPKVTGQKLGL